MNHLFRPSRPPEAMFSMTRMCMVYCCLLKWVNSQSYVGHKIYKIRNTTKVKREKEWFSLWFLANPNETACWLQSSLSSCSAMHDYTGDKEGHATNATTIKKKKRFTLLRFLISVTEKLPKDCPCTVRYVKTAQLHQLSPRLWCVRHKISTSDWWR